MAKKPTKRIQPDEVPNLEVPITEPVEQETLTWTPGQATPRYVVTRGGLRVSDKDYPKPDEDRALSEAAFWQKVVKRHPDGTKIEIVQFDKKKHRIW
jgi:hypothetical protein